MSGILLFLSRLSFGGWRGEMLFITVVHRQTFYITAAYNFNVTSPSSLEWRLGCLFERKVQERHFPPLRSLSLSVACSWWDLHLPCSLETLFSIVIPLSEIEPLGIEWVLLCAQEHLFAHHVGLQFLLLLKGGNACGERDDSNYHSLKWSLYFSGKNRSHMMYIL